MEKDITKHKPHQKLLLNGRTLLFGRTKNTILTIVIVAGLGFFAWRVFGQKKTQMQYQTALVQRGTIIATVTENGNIAAIGQATVGSPTTGIVNEIYVKDGDVVTQGQNLFKVKSTATAQEISSAYASYLAAQATLDTATSKMNSLQSALFKANQAFLTDRGVVNPSDQQKADPVYIEENANWLQAEADYKNQAGVITQAQAALHSAALSYQATQDSIVTAPISGTIANIAVQVGDGITASAGNLSSELTSTSSTSNSPVLSIGNFSTPYIKVQATEVDIPTIQTGQNATITLNAFSGKTFVGTVQQVDTIGTVTSGVVTYNVFVRFLAPLPDMKPGMSATVTIQTGRKDNVFVIPSTAVQTTNGQTTVNVLQNGQVTSVPVTTGLASDADTEVTSGLSEGETVVIGTISSLQTNNSGTSPFSGTLRFGGGGGAIFRGGGSSGGRGG